MAVALVVLAAGQGQRFGGLKQLAPVGPAGEALMEYTIHDALATGFDRVVVVVRAEIETSIRAHLRPRWGPTPRIHYATQPVHPATGRPLGTAPAVLSARSLTGPDPFAVVNADDFYGRAALHLLVQRLTSGGADAHCVLGYRLDQTLRGTTGAVSRALCDCRPDGGLERLVESTITVGPAGALLAGPIAGGPARPVARDQLVSMNAWGFRPSIWPALEAGATPPAGTSEALLPAVVSGLAGRVPVDVVPVAGPCLGVTWAPDVPGVRHQLAALVEAGDYPATLGSPR